MVTWVIQKNLFNERGYDQLVSTLERMGVPHVDVRVVPFSGEYGELSPEVEDGPRALVAYGSTTLMRIAIKRRWRPGVFFDEENFSAPAWFEHWGEHVLNYGAEVVPFKDVSVPPGEYRFIRPADDLKAFSGHVIYSDSFAEWKERVLGVESPTLPPDHPCVVAPVREIAREYRFFVVDGRVVTGSIYKLGENVVYRADVEDYVTEYAQARVDEWKPADGFVIDVAAMRDGSLRVIEVNCLNSAGFYACDASKIVQAVSDHYERKKS